jgi:Lipopolysaccharide-assembly
MTLKTKIKLLLKNIILFLAFITISFGLNSCKVYSFTGTTLSKDIKTFTIQNFTMGTAGGPQNLSLKFNEKLKEYYQRNTDLKYKTSDGDLYLEGSIVAYELSPVSTTSSDKAASNRLTITMEVRFINKLNEEENFEKEFSFYQDFSQEQSLSQAEPNLVPKILDQLVLIIFNATAATW